MEFLKFVAPVISNPITIYVVVALLTAWAMLSVVSLRVKSGRLIKSLREARVIFDQFKDAPAFSERYEAVNAQLERSAVLGAYWRPFRDTLVFPRRPHAPIRATVQPSNWFNLDLLRAPRIGLDLRYHAAMPNLLVGAGLLFTFLGLAVALGSASGVVSSAPDKRNEALHTLLDTASFKFVTSLAGMFLSITYALLRKHSLHAVERAIDQFLVALERCFPLTTPVAVQQEQISLLERQTTCLESFSNDLAVAIGSAIDQTFNDRLAEHIGPLTEAIGRLSESRESHNEDAMRTMLDAFLSKLDSGAGDHMSGVTESLSGLAESLRAVAEQTRDAGAHASGTMVQGIGNAAANFEQVATLLSNTLTEAATAMERRMSQQANESSERLAAQLEVTLTQLSALSESSRAAGSEAFETLVNRVGAASAAFEGTAMQVAAALEKAASDTGGVFGKGAEHAVERIAAATEGMREEIQLVFAELRSSVGEAGEALRTGSAQSAEAMRTTLETASGTLAAALSETAQRLASAGDEAGAALQRGGAGAGERLTQATSIFGERASGLAGQVANLAAAANGLAERTTAFERAAGAAAGPLSKSASDLKSAGEMARAALEPLAQTAQAVARTVQQVADVSKRLEAAVSSAAQLSARLDEAGRRFEGVDGELGKTISTLQSGLQGFTKQVSVFVGQTDTNLAKAATQLAQLVSSLNETLEDYTHDAPTRRRA